MKDIGIKDKKKSKLPVNKKKSTSQQPFPDCPLFCALPTKQQVFVLNIVNQKSGLESATLAGYAKGSAVVTASKLLTNANIKAALTEIKAKIYGNKVADAQEIREYWTQIKRGDIGEICQWGDGGLSFNSTSEGMEKAKRQLIKKITVKEKTSPKCDYTEVQTSVELHDPLRASELLAKDLGMLREKMDINLAVETYEQKRKRLGLDDK